MLNRWIRPDISEVSGMANVIVGIPTGFIISRDTIEWMYRANFTGLQRVRFYMQKLITFFSYVSTHWASALHTSCFACRHQHQTIWRLHCLHISALRFISYAKSEWIDLENKMESLIQFLQSKCSFSDREQDLYCGSISFTRWHFLMTVTFSNDSPNIF